LTGFPSPSPFGYGLGPTNPGLTNIAQGNLRLTAIRILTGFIATYSDILTSHHSTASFDATSLQWERSPTA